jgi:hopanoid biosynthesis associated RND transporter like protein HpnN
MKIKLLTDDSLVARALRWLAGAVCRHRKLFLLPQMALFALCIFYTVHGLGPRLPGLQFDMDQNNLVGANKKYHHNFLEFKREFPGQDDLVVVVESDDAEKNRQFVERIGPLLEQETNLFQHVIYRTDPNWMGHKAMLFASESDLKELRATLKSYSPFISQFTHTTNLNSLFNLLNTQFRTAKREENEENSSLVKAIPALERIVVQARDAMRRPGPPPSPGVATLFDPTGESLQQMYVTYAKGRIFLVTAQALNDDLNEDAVARLRQLVEKVKTEVPGLNVGLTGEPVLDVDQMAQSKTDSGLASIASLIICAVIFIYGYQETGRPIKATLCLIIGLGYSLAFATLAVGHLNILTITFMPILIGLAIDYGVHLISRYEEELRRGQTEEHAMAKAMVFTGQGILTGGLTTAGAFLAMGLTDFKGIQEMGVICGGGLVVSLVPMMTMLPALLLKGKQNQLDHTFSADIARRARIEKFWLERPLWVAAITVALCGLAATQFHKIYFDYDLRNMQSKGLPAVVFEKELINSADKSVLFGAVTATNLQDALRLEQQLTNLDVVANVDSMAHYLAEDQTRKLALLGDVKSDVASITFAEPDPRTVNLPELSATLYSFYGYLGLANEEAAKEDPALGKALLSLRDAVGELRKEMLKGDDARLAANSRQLALFQQALLNDVRAMFQTLQNQDNSGPLRVEDLPKALRDRFVGVTGKHLLMVYPKKDLWERVHQKEFIDQVTTVYAKVTGTPVQLYHYTELLKESYQEAAKYSLAAIVLLVMFHFRSPLCVAMSLIPVGIGFLWLGGLMGFFGIPLNPANIMTLPLVIGIGVTNGIHILNRFAEEQTASILTRSTGKAVLVSGLTAISGFGSLALGKHQGIQSLGLVMAIGLATCMVAGLTFLPCLLHALARPARDKKQPGADNARPAPGREEPR